MRYQFELKQEDRTNYFAVMKLAKAWQELTVHAVQGYCETPIPDDHFKTYVENMVAISQTEKGLDEKSIEFVTFVYERLKEFREQLDIMKTALDCIPRGIFGLQHVSLITLGICTPDNIATFVNNERNWMHDFENAVMALYNDDPEAMRREGYQYDALWMSIPPGMDLLTNILVHAGGNKLANMMARIETYILELEESGVLSMSPAYQLK